MRKHLTRAAAAAMLFALALGALAADTGPAYGRKTIGKSERVSAMVPTGTVRRAPAGALMARSAYSTVNGSMQYTANYRLTNRRVYSIEPSSGTLTMLDTPEVFASGGGVLIGDRYYCMTRLKVMRNIYTRFYVFDADKWETIEYRPDLEETLNAMDVTYDPTTGRVFGCFFDGDDKWVFGTIDYASLSREAIASCPRLNALAADEAGKIYAIGMDGALYGVDKYSGQLSLIGQTGVKASVKDSYWQGSAVFDPVSGSIIYSAYSTTAENPSDDDFIGALWAVDPATGQTTQLRRFSGDELFDGLYIPREPLIDEVPAAPTGLEADFPGGALTGTVSFRMPEKLVGGMNAGKSLSYTLKANGVVVGEGQAAAGQQVSVGVTLEAGSYCFAASVSNSEGTSREATIIQYVGVDRPARPDAAAVFDYTTSAMTVEWEPVTTTTSGTRLPDGAVSYRVTRMPDRQVVADGIADVSFSETLAVAEPRGVSYLVEALADGQVSGAAETREICVGAYDPAFSEDFTDKAGMRFFTVIDLDGDRLTWECSPIDHAARVAWDNGAAATERKDDWLVSPPLRLAAGKVYKLSFGSRKLYDPETLTVALGANPRAEAMTTILLPPTTVTNDRVEIREIDVTVEADGVYFIGFHAGSPRDAGALYVGPFSVAEGVVAAAPAAVTDMEVVPAADRSHSATVRFTAPVLAMDGSALSALDAVEVYRDGALVASVPSAPGADGSYVDNDARQGLNTYTLRPRNGAGSGFPMERTAFIGWDEPNRVERVRARELDTDGTVEITWTAPELDNNNSPLTVDALRYDVFMSATLPDGSRDTRQVGADVKGTAHTAVVCAPDERRFAEFNVVAKTEGGEAREVWTPGLIPAGKPYDAPFAESFANARFENFWGVYSDYVMGATGLSWEFSDDYTYDITSQDSDNGFLVLAGNDAGDESEIYSSKINLAGLDDPAFTFYSYNIKGSGDDVNHNMITVSVSDGAECKVAATIDMGQYNEDGWQRVSVPLAEYRGKTVQILVKGTIVNFLTIALDNFRVDATYARNLSAEAVAVPAKALLDKKYHAYATVRNTGLEAIDGYSLDFYRDDDKIESRNGRALGPGETQTHEFEICHDINSADKAEYWCVVNAEGDMCADDDTSRRTLVKVCVPNFPAVTTLHGSDLGNTPELSWSAPDLGSTEPFEIIEDFESYPAFANSGLADWTLFDADRALIGGIEDANEGKIELPGIPAGSMQSWFVMDGDYERLNFTYRANSGHQHLATMYCYGMDNGIGYETANDDWLISPPLAPGSDEFSFFARGYSSMAPDALEVLATTETGDDPMALRYVSLGRIDPVPASWEEYYVGLPAGTRRFALRSVGNFGFMLFVDDITFTPAAGASMLEVKGYNIYRDGVRINDEPVASTSFVDRDAPDGNHTYGVTTVYNRGESRMSNRVSLTSAIDVVSVGNIEIKAANGCVVVEGAAGEAVGVYAADGRELYATPSAASTLRVALPAGIYLVRAASATAKVSLR